jgi:TonB family protein
MVCERTSRGALLVSAVALGSGLGCAKTSLVPPATPWPSVTLPYADNVLPMNDAPVVVVDGTHVLVGRDVVGDVTPITEAHRMMRIDGLFERLKAMRAEWKTAHPNEAFPGEVNLVFDAGTSAIVVKSAFQTAAFAGYPSASFVVRRASPGPDGAFLGRLPVDAQVPGPPRGGVLVGDHLATGRAGFASAPSLRQGATSTNGRLPAEVIQRIVRQHFGAMRGCYESGLARDGKLSGRVTVRFVISREGRVTEAAPVDPSNASPRLADPAVVACVVDAFAKLTFPAPDGGTVTVVYPINFNPGD